MKNEAGRIRTKRRRSAPPGPATIGWSVRSLRVGEPKPSTWIVAVGEGCQRLGVRIAMKTNLALGCYVIPISISPNHVTWYHAPINGIVHRHKTIGFAAGSSGVLSSVDPA